MVGFIVALESETPNIFTSIKDVKKSTINGFNVYLFNILDEYCALIYSGVGKANAASATQSLINNFKVDKIINIGSCGAVSKKALVGDIALPNIVCYYDVDVTAFGYKMNQIPYEPVSFKSNEMLNETIWSILKLYPHRLIKGTLSSGETFITKDNVNKFKLTDAANVVDMEGCAIAQVCTNNNIKFALIKLVSDSIYETSDSSKQWSQNILGIGETINKIIMDVAYKLTYQKQKSNSQL